MADKEKCTPGGCGDGCNCAAEDEDADFITLEFDDGVEVECEIMGVFDYDGKEYIALIPEDGSDDVYIYGYKEVGDDEFELVDIEDDAEFERVAAEFDKISAEEA
ncbi:MAG: DUF1292 domain-containing protein [Anaerovorax sp.]